ncbi:IS982 family transposase [Brevibacterium gallinarum]|uniref:IS982 family transposase n=1 Tax=Brevibacterium gallinarum TaxID=2762220 RepID=A0ABR8WXY6_9MICO|nr:IS982 family transposase [Brevibacterium gallinarum]BFF05147.1 IS982 family transposase [Brevibacterium otitidis]MBD8021961.1 IS982 family transposase [Brevibacterium gallinarum]BFF05651.1 IS982 family transposase [Brevibacterium otitidis]BFF05688.1 IS982 family transposase [Brevibacterium otitidis]BFF05839.1 IS982 family transposase [Brevibacterium otitidis]
MDNDLDTLATALYVTTDDYLKANPHLTPWRPRVGMTPRISDAELITLAVMQSLLGFHSERRWIRYARARLISMFPTLPQQAGYNKRLRRLTGLMQQVVAHLAADTGLWTDDVWVADSTPVECGRSRETVKRSDLAGYAEYGYCASHSRFFWGLRLHLLATLDGLPVGFALTGAKADERDTLQSILETTPAEVTAQQTIMADKGYYGRVFERELDDSGITLLRPARKGEPPRAGARFLKPLRQTIESVFDTLKGQLGLEQHGGRTIAGVVIRVLQRLLALTTAIWHNQKTGQPVLRSLTAYDH